VSWLTLVICGIGTYAIRLSFIALFGRMQMPDLLQRALRLVPPAVLSAIVFPELLMKSGQLDLSFSNTRLIAGLVAILIAWRTHNTLLTIVIGMALLWLLQWAGI
jgi:branched-subunit amino acid transport protein